VCFCHDDFGNFDTFPGNKGRPAHLAGKVGRALIAKTPELLDGMPQIENTQVLATSSRTRTARSRTGALVDALRVR
jgi:hypothetical protein